MVRVDTEKLNARLGAADRRKVDEYLYAVREIEKRIESVEKNDHEVRPAMDKPAGVPITFAEYARLMFDLQVVAFQADLTRVTTLMLGREGSMRVYPEIEVPAPHPPLTHHRNNPDWIERVAKINCLHAETFAYFLNRLKATKEASGTVLDHSMVVYLM